LHEERAALHERGLADHELISSNDRDSEGKIAGARRRSQDR
jgi:hypothetical protein